MRITEVSNKCVELVKRFEGFSSKPYLCPANVPTIGFGLTLYPLGKRVRVTDPPISEELATKYLLEILNQFAKQVDAITIDTVTQSQFDGLVSFAYNCGVANLKGSTLLKKVNKDPNDKTIQVEFMKWIYAAGKPLKGLEKRRAAEWELYKSV